jgi:DHA1 family inner membrane transport protein
VLSTPLRLLLTLRPKVPLGVLVTTAVSTVVFASTPFLITGVADEFDVDVAKVGLISTAQLSGFMLASWGAGRFFRPRRRMMVAAVAIGIVANLCSALAPSFGPLVAFRFVSGVSLGLIAWVAWAEVFGDDERSGDVAVVGPIVGTLASPAIAVMIDRFGASVRRAGSRCSPRSTCYRWCSSATPGSPRWCIPADRITVPPGPPPRSSSASV